MLKAAVGSYNNQFVFCITDRQIIWETIELLRFLPVVLQPSAVIHRFESETTNQSQDEGLNSVNHPRVCTAQREELTVTEKTLICCHQWPC